ncbi:MAG: hypothetical protein N3B11_00375 [Coriobacteriia bacterium]|nr:hypothetical protein [Coriobacteriia bacterium]
MLKRASPGVRSRKHSRERDSKLGADVLDSVSAVVRAVAACAGGLAFGFGFAVLSRLGVSFVRPGQAFLGLAVVSSLTFLRLVVCAAALYACSVVAPEAVPAFGISVVAAFLVSTVAEGIREVRSVSSGMSA